MGWNIIRGNHARKSRSGSPKRREFALFVLKIKRRFFCMLRKTRSKLTCTHHLVMTTFSNFLTFHTFRSRQTNFRWDAIEKIIISVRNSVSFAYTLL